MALRNIPTDKPASLASLAIARAGTVASRALFSGAVCSGTLLAFAPGESVSEEEYFEDVMYFLAEGKAEVVLPERRVLLRAGDVFAVPAHVLHAVEGADPAAGFKLLQIAVGPASA